MQGNTYGEPYTPEYPKKKENVFPYPDRKPDGTPQTVPPETF